MQTECPKMAPFNTTLMGVLKGVLDHYGYTVSPATVFGASGHAFLINIHRDLCPSGPYCWNRSGYERLIGNLGVKVTDLGFFSPGSSADARAGAEQKLREALDAGLACALVNLENQLITGYDHDGFATAQPWACLPDFPPARLSFGSWRELGDTFHANFYVYEKTEPADRTKSILDSLDYALELHANPAQYSREGYGIGPEAYAYWLEALPRCGGSHGNWWNAMVWSECRRMASEYLGEIEREYPAASQAAAEAGASFDAAAGCLEKAGDKAMDSEAKGALIREAQSTDAEAIRAVATLASALLSPFEGG